MGRIIMRTTVAALSLLAISGIGLFTADGALASTTATVVAVNYRQGDTVIHVVVAVPNKIDNAARKRGIDYGVCVSVSYVSTTNSFETVNSARVSISATSAVGASKGDTWDDVSLDLGTHSVPGSDPGYSPAAFILDPGEACPFPPN